MTENNQSNTVCPSCKNSFTCGITAGDDNCWCFYYPRMMPIPRQDKSTECACLCPKCLEDRIMIGNDDTQSQEQQP